MTAVSAKQAAPAPAIQTKARWIDPFTVSEIERLTAQFGSPLLILDCERVRQQYRRLQAALPGIELHYALKPMPHPAVVRTLDGLGAKFDLATSGEIALV